MGASLGRAHRGAASAALQSVSPGDALPPDPLTPFRSFPSCHVSLSRPRPSHARWLFQTRPFMFPGATSPGPLHPRCLFPSLGREGRALVRAHVPSWHLPELRGPRSPPTCLALSWAQPSPLLVTAFPDTFSSPFCAALCPSPRSALLLPAPRWLPSARPAPSLLRDL